MACSAFATGRWQFPHCKIGPAYLLGQLHTFHLYGLAAQRRAISSRTTLVSRSTSIAVLTPLNEGLSGTFEPWNPESSLADDHYRTALQVKARRLQGQPWIDPGPKMGWLAVYTSHKAIPSMSDKAESFCAMRLVALCPTALPYECATQSLGVLRFLRYGGIASGSNVFGESY